MSGRQEDSIYMLLQFCKAACKQNNREIAKWQHSTFLKRKANSKSLRNAQTIAAKVYNVQSFNLMRSEIEKIHKKKIITTLGEINPQHC